MDFPPTASMARRIFAPAVASLTCFGKPLLSTKTTSPPIAFTAATADSRLTTLTVFKPRIFASWIRYSPTPELAAFCITHSPGSRSTNSCNIKCAVGGFTVIIANCSGSTPFGSGINFAASATMWVDQVPAPTGNSTVCPIAGDETPGPHSAITPTPSLPPIAGNGGSMPYTPVSVSTSEGLIGAASTLISTWPGPSGGKVNSTAAMDACGTGPRSVYWARCI